MRNFFSKGFELVKKGFGFVFDPSTMLIIMFAVLVTFLATVVTHQLLEVKKDREVAKASVPSTPSPDRFEVVSRQEVSDGYHGGPTVLLIVRDRSKGTCQTLAVRSESATPLNQETPCTATAEALPASHQGNRNGGGQ